MRKERAVGTLAVPVKILGDHGRDRPGNADEAVVVDADPNNVEPRQAAPWCPPGTSLATAALGEPVDGPYPGPDRVQVSEILLLLVKVRRDVMAHEREERGYGKGFVAVAQHLEVDGVPVESERQERCGRIDGYHEEDANDAVGRGSVSIS